MKEKSLKKEKYEVTISARGEESYWESFSTKTRAKKYAKSKRNIGVHITIFDGENVISEMRGRVQ